MTEFRDGPSSSLFTPLSLQGNVVDLDELTQYGISEEMAQVAPHAPSGEGIAWGIPFGVGDVVVVADQSVAVEWNPVTAQWLVFMHTSDLRRLEPDAGYIRSTLRRDGAGAHTDRVAAPRGQEAQAGDTRRARSCSCSSWELAITAEPAFMAAARR